MYDFVKRTAELYSLLQDGKSKEVFEARLVYDLQPSVRNKHRLIFSALPELQGIVSKMHKEHHKLWIYGAIGMGQNIARFCLESGIEVCGFCDQRAGQFPDGLLGRPVILPEHLLETEDSSFVVVAAYRAHQEILDWLKAARFPQERIHEMSEAAFWFADGIRHTQYFEFPDLYSGGSAFIDAGACNCSTSLEFTKWCDGNYTKIFAFEPEPENFKLCEKNAEAWGIRDISLFQSGLSSHSGTTVFLAGIYNASHIINMTDNDAEGSYEQIIQTTTIDEIAKGETVGFIKMDIEGAEYDALHGARNTIQRDMPFLAVCVYHRQGDMLAIMDYLHKLVPEYHFWLRHYNLADNETILYASVKETTDCAAK